MSDSDAHSGSIPLVTLRAEVERLWRQLADVTAAASQAGLIPPGTQPRADLDTAQSALAHALRELRVGEGRSAMERGPTPGNDPAPRPASEQARERLAAWQSSAEQMERSEEPAYAQRAAAAEAVMGEHRPPADAGPPQPETASEPPTQPDASPGGTWGGRLRAVARQLVDLRQRLADVGEIDPLSPEWAPLTVAASLVELAADGLDSLLAVSPATATGDESVVADERATLVAALRPRLHTAAADALAALSLHELRALAAHPDTTAALVLLVGLATRGEVIDPEVTVVEAASLLSDLGVTPAAVQHLIVEGSLPTRPLRSHVLAVPIGDVLAACRAVGAGVRDESTS